MVEEFTARNYLDDQDYAQNKAAYWQGMGSSRKTIRRKLLRDGLEAGLVESVISQMDPDLEYDSARKAALGMLKTMKAQSARYKRQLVVRRLENRGFSPEIARQTGEDLELEQDDGEALQHALDNAARLYISLEEDKRKEKILQYCLRQGFTADEVQERLPDVFALQHALDNAARLYISLEEDKRKEKILQYCLRQGFTADEVQERLPDVFARMERQTLAAETDISLEEDKRKEKILQYCLRQGFTADEVQERLPDVFARMERQTLAAETGASHAEEDASADSQED